ncbi:MAG: tRNA (cytidine(34)-2'-O)-methyltransferase [Eubacterium sp.]|jgi:tRNA (cytidine/uridine-2'-O-)-methyltransferase|nr:tRNA (cytidine(34)-2'-O)-methyltransferase [Eubacterium sp.]
MLNIVLLEPEMPANTGNIGRTCVITGSSLHLIEPLGFRINEKQLKRAGLDYWPRLDVHLYANVEEFYDSIGPDARVFYATTKGKNRHSDVEFRDGDYIMFGKESAGIPEEILVEHPDTCIRIPMLPEERSLNLANSVAIVTYEALRQMDYPGLETEGNLHRLEW